MFTVLVALGRGEMLTTTFIANTYINTGVTPGEKTGL